jgi:hypothetical protein
MIVVEKWLPELQRLAGGLLSASGRMELDQGKQELVEGLTTFTPEA